MNSFEWSIKISESWLSTGYPVRSLCLMRCRDSMMDRRIVKDNLDNQVIPYQSIIVNEFSKLLMVVLPNF